MPNVDTVCLHGFDLAYSRCEPCGHPERFITRPPRGAVHDDVGRRIPKTEQPLIVIGDAKVDPITARAQAILAGELCGICLTPPFKGLCRCQRLAKFESDKAEISDWASRNQEHSDAGWVAISGLRRASFQAGRGEPRGGGKTLIGETMGDAFDNFEFSDKWRPPRNGRADDLPV